MAKKKSTKTEQSFAIKTKKRSHGLSKNKILLTLSAFSLLIIGVYLVSIKDSKPVEQNIAVAEEEELFPSHILLNASYQLEEEQGAEAALAALEEDILNTELKFDSNDKFLFKRVGELKAKLDDYEGAYQATLLSLGQDKSKARIDLVLQHAGNAFLTERNQEALNLYQTVLARIDEYRDIYEGSDFSEQEINEIINQNKSLVENQIRAAEERLSASEN